MADELAAQIAQLNAVRELVGEAAYREGLAKLRAMHGAAAVEVVLQAQPTHGAGGNTQIVTGTAKTGAAVAGSVYGNIYVNGQWTRDEATLVRQYLQRLTGRCETLPLQGIREQKSSTDVLAIKLDRVYTQLATTGLAQREVFEGAALQSFDGAAFVREHQGDHLLPAQQRTYLSHQPDAAARVAADHEFRRMRERIDVRPLDRRMAESVTRPHPNDAYLAFFGPQLVSEAIAECQRLVLLGEPGSGKSTALRFLTLVLAEAGLQEDAELAERLQGWEQLAPHSRPLPIFYPLLSFAQRLAKDVSLASTAHDLWNALAAFIDPGNTGVASVIHDRLHSGDVLLLLDGLDEVATTESRRKVVQAVQQFATEYHNCRIVVTCRVRAYQGERNSQWQLHGWPTATLAPWTPGQMEHFVPAWYHEAALASNRTSDWRNGRVGALKTALNRRADLRRLGERPLLLTIMALVHFNDGRLPEDSVSLYRRCIEILLGQWELGRADGSAYGTLMAFIGLPNHSVEALRPLLEAAAFRAHEAKTDTDPGSLSSQTLRLLVMDALKEHGHPEPYTGAEKFLDYTDKRAGLLQASDAGDAYVFPHLTFQEYLAGMHLTSGLGVVDKIMARRNADRWRVPVILGVGDHVSGNKLEMPYRLFNELLDGEERTLEQHQRDLLFAADLGQELGWDRLEGGDKAFKRVRRELAQQLGGVVEGTVLPAGERVRAGVYLGALGDPRPGVCSLPPFMISIPGGTFVIGHTQAELAALREALPADKHEWFDDTLNEQPVAIKPFALAKYPVTNAQFALFMDDYGYDPNAPWWDESGRAWLRQSRTVAPRLWDDPRYGIARPNHPVVGVNWYEARAFCRWLTQNQQFNPDQRSYRLPSEAEWEWAARGAERRMYPWGNQEPGGELANHAFMFNGTTAVGCFVAGATPEGVLDLAGNVWEWTSSVYLPYPYEPTDGRELPVDAAQKRFTLRGGAWNFGSLRFSAAIRDGLTPDNTLTNVGFRLATHLAV